MGQELRTFPRLARPCRFREIFVSARATDTPRPAHHAADEFRILLVDDDPDILKFFKRLLDEDGHSVVAVDSGSAALCVLQAEAIDLLVLDLSMPAPDGFDLLKSLRASMPGLPILIVSGFMQGSLLKVSELLGATASLSKTDAPRLLLETVNRILPTSRGKRAPAVPAGGCAR